MPDAPHVCEGATLRGVRACLRTDVERAIHHAAAYSGSHAGLLRRISFALTPPIMSVAVHRLAHLLHVRGYGRVARLLARVNLVVHRAELTPSSCIGAGFYLPHPTGAVFHGTAARNLTLYYRACVLPAAPTVGPSVAGDAAPRLGSDVTLGVFSVITGAVRIGDRVFVGATTTVVENLEEGVTALTGQRGQLHRRRERASRA